MPTSRTRIPESGTAAWQLAPGTPGTRPAHPSPSWPENAEVFAARLVDIARNGENADALRAIEALNSRVLGKPKETVEQIEAPAELRALDEMTPEERWALWRQLYENEEGVDPAAT